MSKQQREASRRERVVEMQRQAAVHERNRRLLITGAIVVVLCAVVAGVRRVLRQWRLVDDTVGHTSRQGLRPVAGDRRPDSAPHKVVVYEDFLCPYCRQFETSSRDFLRDAAAKGKVQVEYRPFHLLQDDYSTRALSAWAAVLQSGTPQQALKFHDLLYDNQPYEHDPNKPDAATLTSWAKQAGRHRPEGPGRDRHHGHRVRRGRQRGGVRRPT